MKNARCGSAHFHSELLKDLVKNRHDFYDQHKEDRREHAQHDQRISQSVPDAAGLFPLIMGGQGSEGVIQISGELAHFYHVNKIGRKNFGFFQCRLNISGFQQFVVNDGQNFLPVFRVGIIPQDRNAFQKGDSCL